MCLGLEGWAGVVVMAVAGKSTPSRCGQQACHLSRCRSKPERRHNRNENGLGGKSKMSYAENNLVRDGWAFLFGRCHRGGEEEEDN